MHKAGIIMTILLLGMLAFIWNSCSVVSVKPVKQPEPAFANEVCAKTLLENTAQGMIIYSIKNGNGGKRNFAKNLDSIKDLVIAEAAAAFPGKNQTPYEGVVLRLEEYPQGDNFKNNFRVIAEPAHGFIGEVYMIDKLGKVSKVK